MCGIAAIVPRDPGRPVPPARLAAMVDTLRHRGPDDAGQVALPGAGLGMRRLSIIDVQGGRQPFASEDGAVHLVGNGEIYNHDALRAQLEARDHRFASGSDVETALHAYEEWGESFVERLHGMFALALWDARSRTLLAARDRAGEKPLYYALTADGLLLASEIKALLTCPEVSREVDLEALDQFLTYEYVLTPRTIFSAVRRLPAAHRMTYSGGALTLTRYWSAAGVPRGAWTDDEAAAALRGTLRRAVSRQTMADVPLGAFLSGGLDSSAIVAMMAEAGGRGRSAVNTFSMGFADGSYDELPHARRVAARFGTRHREGTVEPDVAALFHRLIPHFDEPFADVSLFPTFLVSEIARAHVTVALSGDGGDELFGGYDTYHAERLARRVAAVLPRPAAAALAGLAALFPPSEKKKGLLNKVRRFTSGLAAAPPDVEHYRWMTYLSAAGKRRLYTPALRAALAGSDAYRPVREALGAAGTDDALNRQLHADLSLYLADDILVKVDRMSMAASLETRAPFLDVEVLKLALSMPGRLKVRRGERKYVLKRAMAGVLPDSILRRPKEGFSIPMKNWLKRDLAPLMRDLLSPERIRRRGWFEPGAVAALIDRHVAGRENHAHVLFGLMVLERWAQAHADGDRGS